MKVGAAAITTTTTEVKLDGRLQHQLLAKLEEYERLTLQIKAREARQEAIAAEIDGLFDEAGEYTALLNGSEIEGFRVKLVCGTTKRLDKIKLMRDHGLTQAQLDACSPETPNKPYVRITPPKAKSGSGA